ncbi:MAG: hypothetical protein E3J21_11740 [Anaerolineales bacterium]|nr:MAG: hypothetical protein E3J21_11740 [Anaerolineales bacterium]
MDVVGLNRRERRVLFGEAKWTREPLTESVLDTLIDRSNRWLGGDTSWDVHYALFGRGFGQACGERSRTVRERAGQEPGVYLFSPADILKT